MRAAMEKANETEAPEDDSMEKKKKGVNILVKVVNGIITTLLFAFLPPLVRRAVKQVLYSPPSHPHLTPSRLANTGFHVPFFRLAVQAVA